MYFLELGINIGFNLFQPSLWATASILLVVTLVAGDRHFGRRSGLPDFATNDLLRHARASSTLLEEYNEQEAESRQLPVRRELRAKQRQLRPVLNSQGPTNVRPIRSRNHGTSVGSAQLDGVSNFIQGEWPRKAQNEKRVGGVQDNFGHFTRRRKGNTIFPYTKRFGPNDGFEWPKNFASFGPNAGFEWPKNFGSYNNDHNSNRRFSLDKTLGYFSAALRLLSYLVRMLLQGYTAIFCNK